MRVHSPLHSTWNESVEHLFPYKYIESDPRKLELLFRNDQEEKLKERDLNLRDVLKQAPNATRKKGRKRVEDYEEEEDNSIWPLPPLEGCPKEGVLTIQPAGHLGSMMTQFSMLYALSRRDSKYAFLPPELDVPLKQTFENVRKLGTFYQNHTYY